jgi:hypothetical protein
MSIVALLPGDRGGFSPSSVVNLVYRGFDSLKGIPVLSGLAYYSVLFPDQAD